MSNNEGNSRKKALIAVGVIVGLIAAELIIVEILMKSFFNQKQNYRPAHCAPGGSFVSIQFVSRHQVSPLTEAVKHMNR